MTVPTKPAESADARIDRLTAEERVTNLVHVRLAWEMARATGVAVSFEQFESVIVGLLVIARQRGGLDVPNAARPTAGRRIEDHDVSYTDTLNQEDPRERDLKATCTCGFTAESSYKRSEYEGVKEDVAKKVLAHLRESLSLGDDDETVRSACGMGAVDKGETAARWMVRLLREARAGVKAGWTVEPVDDDPHGDVRLRDGSGAVQMVLARYVYDAAMGTSE
jgi:hypothetical protein